MSRMGRTYVRKSISERFWPKVLKGQGKACWEWQGARQHGYGIMMISTTCRPRGSKLRHAHRVVWELECGPIPSGMFVLHRCDNPACVRPSHLFLGTQRDNMRDMRKKGRGASVEKTRHLGEEHGRAILDELRVLAIRRRYAAGGVTQAALAKEFGVAERTVFHVIHRLTWRHLD